MKMPVYIKDTDATQLNKTIAEFFSKFNLTRLKGKRVLVKPNMLRPARQDEGVVTSPELLSAVVSNLLAARAEVVVADNPAPNSSYNILEIARRCGFLDASQGKFSNIGIHPVLIKLKRGLLREVYVSKEVLECDFLISLPRFKVHDLTLMTLGIKNQFGIVPGALKPYIHKLFPDIDRFSQVLLEIYQIRPPDLIIVDALDVVDGGGKRFTLNKLIAGDDGYAVDYVCARMAGINPLDVPTIDIARTKRYFSPKKVEWVGDLAPIPGFKRPLSFPFRKNVVELIGRLFYRIWLKRVPWIDRRLCRRCDFCSDICPVNAIDKLSVNYEKCIRCYCCIEVCPHQAIKKRILWLS